MSHQPPRFEEITEAPGVPLTPEAASMLATRYALAVKHARGGRVLELGCGAGTGLGLLARRASQVIGGDFSRVLLGKARAHYGRRVPLVRLSAEALPFRNSSLDLLVFFEASYYVPDMERAFDEATRVLAPRGTLLFANANPDRPDFIRSPHSTHYHNADQFRESLERRGLTVEVSAAFPLDRAESSTGAVIGQWWLQRIRRLLEALHLVPRTLAGRARLKRLLTSRMLDVPPELWPDFAPAAEPVPVTAGPVSDYKVIYVAARRPS